MGDYRKIRGADTDWSKYLPDEIYDDSTTSWMHRLLDATCGDSGVGGQRKSLMLKRLQTSLDETRYSDLDAVYSGLFGLPRLPEEQYSQTVTDLLTWAQREEMEEKDAMYRGRVAKYMLALQYGGTDKGIELAAEAACGHECRVVGPSYWATMGVENGSDSPQSIGLHDRADWNECVVVAMCDELDEVRRKSVHDVLKRIAPVDCRVTLRTRKEVSDKLVLSNVESSEVVPVSVESSSRWWNLVKTVTGRPDWEFKVDPRMWVEPNVAKEAPTLCMEYSQGSVEDFTYLVTECSASSEHIGPYGSLHASLFNLRDEGLRPAEACLSTSTSKSLVTNPYGASAVNGSYPTEYMSAVTTSFSEEARAARAWSSDEREGNEWLELSFKRAVPVSRVEFSVCQKPVEIIPWATSTGGKVWTRLSKDGLPLSFKSPSWGGGTVKAVFECDPSELDGLRLEIRRLDVPYKVQSGDIVERLDFLWSVEISDLSASLHVRGEDDFRPAVFNDMFGNRVDLGKRELPASNILEGGYWVSRPNIGGDAVEWLVFDFGEPVKFNAIECQPVYGGTQMNLYSSDDGEVWRPYPGYYSLSTGKVSVPSRRTRYVKAEFTDLCSIPFQADDSEQEALLFPWSERQRCKTTSTYQQSYAGKLTATPDDAYDVDDSSNAMGIRDVYQSIENESRTELWIQTLQTSDVYRTWEMSPIVTAYGEQAAIERSLGESTMSAATYEEPRTLVKFLDEGKHSYEADRSVREENLAYVVGVKEFRFLYETPSIAFGGDEFVVYPSDMSLISGCEWEVEEERLKAKSDMSAFETVDLQTMEQFKTFDFAVNQSEPRQSFEHRSHMEEEWHGVNAEVSSVEFGVSGSVLEAQMPERYETGVRYGVESETKLVRARSIAEVQVDVYPQYSGEWVFECRDVYGENVFTMKYDLERGKWTTLGVTFTPQPGGSWWRDRWKYRFRIPVHGPLGKGTSVFVPWMDLESMANAAIIQPDYSDVRVVFYDGLECNEIPRDITGNQELWFRLQEDLLGEANGEYDFYQKKFVGAYYVYFGCEDQEDEPKDDWHDVFFPFDLGGTAEIGEDGTDFLEDGKFLEIPDTRLSDREGYISFSYSPETDPDVPADGELGVASVRFLFDYEDGDRKFQAYTYDNQLTFVIVESDGYENAYVSTADAIPLFEAGRESKVLLQWGSRGSAQIYDDGYPSPSDMRRRTMRAWVDGEEIPCIDNVYDEKRYNEGTR